MKKINSLSKLPLNFKLLLLIITFLFSSCAEQFYIESNHNFINNSTELFNIGNNFFQQSKYRIAVSYYSKAIEINKDFKEAYYNIGLSYYNLNRFNKAIKNFNFAINLGYNNSKIYFYRSECYFNLGYYYLAEIDLINSSKFNNNNVIYTGPRGGKYYYNNNGNKTYLPNLENKTIYTGPRGGKYYYNSTGTKRYISKKSNY